MVQQWDPSGDKRQHKDGDRTETKKRILKRVRSMRDALAEMAYTLINAVACPSSPKNSKEFCLFEGDDHWASVRKYAACSLADMIALNENPSLSFTTTEGEAVNMQLRVLGGGDGSNLVSIRGISGCGGPCACPFCEMPSSKFCDIGVDYQRGQERTSARIAQLAHSVACPSCPGCGMEIVAEVTDPSKQMPIACPDSSPPPKKQWKGSLKNLGKDKTWLEIHKGVIMGHYDLLPGFDWILCLLHLNLRIVNGLFVKLIIKHIGSTASLRSKQTPELIRLITVVCPICLALRFVTILFVFDFFFFFSGGRLLYEGLKAQSCEEVG